MQSLTCNLERTPTAKLLFQLIGLELGGRVRGLSRRLGYRRPQPLDVAAWAAPDSAVARRATELVRELSPAFLFHHAMRTYAFGVAIAEHNRMRFDREIVYLASVMHDLGLTPAYDGPKSFEEQGATKARQFCLEHGVPEARADLVHEAIALHTSVGVATEREPEVALIHLGAGADVIGFHIEDISAETVAAVVEAWPRLGFKERFAALLREQAEKKPQSMIAGHMSLGFDKKIGMAPFAD